MARTSTGRTAGRVVETGRFWLARPLAWSKVCPIACLFPFDLSLICWHLQLQGHANKRATVYLGSESQLYLCKSLRCPSYLLVLTLIFKLYTSGPYPSEILAKVSRGQGSVTLEIAASAIHAGLLEACIVATVLLQCSRNIDWSWEDVHNQLLSFAMWWLSAQHQLLSYLLCIICSLCHSGHK